MITMVTVATEPPGPLNQAQTTGILPVTLFGLGVRTENGRGGAKGSFCSPQKETTHMQGALATLGSPRFLITYKECNYQVWSPSLSPGGSCLSASQAELPGVPVYPAAGWTDGGPQGPHSVPAGTANPPNEGNWQHLKTAPLFASIQQVCFGGPKTPETVHRGTGQPQ